MERHDILDLNKISLSKKNFTRKTSLYISQKIIIFLLTFFMVSFFSYKITYFIYMIKENIKFNIPKIYGIISIEKNENAIINNNTQNSESIENIEINNNCSICKKDIIPLNEDILISESYSEYLEDLILNYFFYDINNGFYIDIGNFSQNHMSVTKFFYLKGWTGINIKPLNEEYKEFIKKRPNDKNLNYYSEGKFNKLVFLENNEANRTYSKLSDLLLEYIPKHKEIHFCKINMKEDIRKILLGNDFENFRPKIICIENNITGIYKQDNEIFEYILNKNDYFFLYQYEIVRYYIDNKIAHLKKRPELIDELIQAYKNKNIGLNME